MTKYGVVGTGYFGAELARFMSKVEGAKITAIYDPVNAAPIAKELNCVATATMEALCTHPDVDCVIIASPNYLHKAPVIAAAKAGKHVFCEKPIALNYQDCKDMVDACKEAGVTFMAGHVMNFFTGFATLKRSSKPVKSVKLHKFTLNVMVLKTCRMRSHGRRFAQSQVGICTITFTS